MQRDGPAVWFAILQRHAPINSKLCLDAADNCAEDHARASAMNAAFAWLRTQAAAEMRFDRVLVISM
jgi:hypothetical protein